MRKVPPGIRTISSLLIDLHCRPGRNRGSKAPVQEERRNSALSVQTESTDGRARANANAAPDVAMGFTAYLAADGYVDELVAELEVVERVHGRLLVASGPPRRAAWAANIWLDPREIPVASISDGA